MMMVPQEDADNRPPLRFLQDRPLPHKRIAVLLLVSALLMLGLMAWMQDSRYWWLGLYVLFALYGAIHYYQNSKYRLPVLIVFPGKGLKSDQFKRGIGWSVIEDVRLEQGGHGKSALVLQLRPGMPWPGRTGLFRKPPKDDPLEGRALSLDLHGMSSQAQVRMLRIVQNHFQAYRSKRRRPRR